MKFLILCVLPALLFAQASAASVKNNAIVGTVQTKDGDSLVSITNVATRYTYVMSTVPYTKEGCDTYCNDNDWDLTGFKLQDEWDFIEESFNAFGHSGIPFWTSGFKYADFWQWKGKGEMEYFEWDTNANEPNYVSESPSLYFYSDLGWYDGSASEIYRCVCEYNF